MLLHHPRPCSCTSPGRAPAPAPAFSSLWWRPQMVFPGCQNGTLLCAVSRTSQVVHGVSWAHMLLLWQMRVSSALRVTLLSSTERTTPTHAAWVILNQRDTGSPFYSSHTKFSGNQTHECDVGSWSSGGCRLHDRRVLGFSVLTSHRSRGAYDRYSFCEKLFNYTLGIRVVFSLCSILDTWIRIYCSPA